MRSLAIAVATVTLSTGLAYGQSTCQSASTAKATGCMAGTTVADACQKSTDDKSAFIAAMKEMGVPMMRCEIGDQETCCPIEAGEIAAKLGTDPVYYVGESRFVELPEALEAWNEQLGSHLATITAVQYTVNGECVGCPTAASQMAEKSGTKVSYQVASYASQCQVTATEVATAAKQAADKIAMSYRVDGKDFCCDKMAGAVVKETGEPMLFVVGEEVMEDQTQASIFLNIAKIQAAMGAITEAQA